MIEKPSATMTVHVQELLEDALVSRSIAVSYPQIERVLIQTAIDIVALGNVDNIAPTLLGIKHVQDILLLFKSRGDVILEKENKKNGNTSK